MSTCQKAQTNPPKQYGDVFVFDGKAYTREEIANLLSKCSNEPESTKGETADRAAINKLKGALYYATADVVNYYDGKGNHVSKWRTIAEIARRGEIGYPGRSGSFVGTVREIAPGLDEAGVAQAIAEFSDEMSRDYRGASGLDRGLDAELYAKAQALGFRIGRRSDIGQHIAPVNYNGDMDNLNAPNYVIASPPAGNTAILA